MRSENNDILKEVYSFGVFISSRGWIHSRISSSYTLSDRSVFVEWSKLKKVHVAEYFLDGGFRYRHINSIWFDEGQKVVPSLFVTALVCVYASMKFACTAYILYTCNVAYIGNAVYLGKIMPRWITHFNPLQKGCFWTFEPVQLVEWWW